jgi:hypothetical protein
MTQFRACAIALVAAVSLWLAAAPGFAQVNIELGIGGPNGGQITLEGQLPRRAGLGGECLNDRQINRAIASGQIRSWPQIRRLAGIPPSYYETSDVQVCLRNGVPYYIVNMSSPKGENVKYVLNALDGSG